MFSQATPDGVMTLTVTFKLGTDPDQAQVQVQNRVQQALPKLPEEVRALGVTTTKQSPDLTMVVHLFSPNNRYDEVYVRNYATLQVREDAVGDELIRIVASWCEAHRSVFLSVCGCEVKPTSARLCARRASSRQPGAPT